MAWKHRFQHISISTKAEWVDFQANQLCILPLLFSDGQLLKKKNLLLLEQILSFKTRPYLRKEAMRNLRKLFPLVSMMEGGDSYHIRMILLGGVHIQLYISKLLACFNNRSGYAPGDTLIVQTFNVQDLVWST